MLRKIVSDKRTFAFIVMFATLFVTITVYASTGFKEVKVMVDSEPVIYAYTSQNTVNDLLVEFGINLDENDKVSHSKEDVLSDNSVIDIKTSKKITVNDAGNSYELYSTDVTVGDLISKGVITLDEENDYMNVTSEDKLFDGMILEIVRVTHVTVTEEETVPFETERIYTTEIEKDTELVVSEGVSGISENTVVITYKNGVEAEKEVIKTDVISEPVDRVIKVGIDQFSKPASYKEIRSFQATAYCACAKCCGVSTGITASGRKAEYGCVAVDPRVIPLGTKLYIECSDGSFIYGHSVAADTGGAIKGNKVDLFFPSHQDALKFGRRAVNVYILE